MKKSKAKDMIADIIKETDEMLWEAMYIKEREEPWAKGLESILVKIVKEYTD